MPKRKLPKTKDQDIETSVKIVAPQKTILKDRILHKWRELTNKKVNFSWRGVLKYTLISLFTLVIFALVLGGYSFLKQRQLCTYQQLVEQGLINYSGDTALCPNMFDTGDWGKILSNAFNFNLLAKVEAKEINYLDLPEVTTTCTDQLNPLCWLKGTKPTLKETGGYTNLLLVGVDTAPGSRSGLKNTDSLMLVTLDNTSGRILLTSFPRDLYVSYTTPGKRFVSSKINAIYASYGIAGLTGAIQQITAREVHYYAFIHFETFVKLIDKFNGVDINLAENFADVYPCSELPAGYVCPKKRFVGDGQYGLFEFPAGWNHFNSTEALVYARARKYSSDYKRAGRQQQVLKAVLDGALKQKGSISDRLRTYLELYNLFTNDVVTNVGVNDIAAVVSLMDKMSGNVAKVVADPNLGGPGRLIYVENRDPVFRDKSYKQFQNYVSNIWKFLPYFVEQPNILVINASGAEITAEMSLYKLLNNGNPYWKVTEKKTEQAVSGIKLYDLSNGSKSGSLRDLQKSLPGSLIYNSTIDDVKQTDQKEDIVIIWGKQ
jgi:LCP family protein required for cell wall assembly